MIKAFENYTLLAGSHGRRGSIWRGPDHLLVVEGSGVLFALGESYRRIDYENIQALSLVRTHRYGWLLAGFSAPLLVMAFIVFAMMASGAEGSTMAVVIVMLGLPLLLVPFVLLVVHLARGRTVCCTIQTAVQSLRLRPLTREANAQRVMAEITELCREHQSGILPQQAALDAGSAPPPMQSAPAGTRRVWNGSPAVVIAGAMALVWGVVLAGELFVAGAGYLMLDGFIGMAALTAVLIALVFAMRGHSPTGLQVALWACCALGLLTAFCALGGIGYAAARLEALDGGDPNPVEAFEYLADLSLEETQAFGWIVVGLGMVIAALGVAMLPYGLRRGATPAAARPPNMV